MSGQKWTEDERKLFKELAAFNAAYLLKQMGQSRMSRQGFLELEKASLMAKLLQIDYAYLRTAEGRETKYVEDKVLKNLPIVNALFEEAQNLLGKLLGRDRLLGLVPEEDINETHDGSGNLDRNIVTEGSTESK